MASKKTNSNPFSTGGGGTNFEQKVGSIYLVSLLARQVPYGLNGITKEVKFQQIHTEHLDDLVVVVEQDTKESKLSLQLKHNVNFTKSDTNFIEIIADCWKTFKNESAFSFDPEIDRFGMGVGVYKPIIGKDILPIRNIARSSKNGKDFSEKRKAFSQKKKQFVNLLESLIVKSKGSMPTEDELWKFLKCFEVLYFELSGDDSKDVTNTWNNLLDLLQKRDVSTATSLFEHLFSIVSNYNPSSGAITYEQLKNKCVNFPLIENPDYSSDIKQLKIHTENYLKSVRDVIAEDIHFDRNKELNSINELMDNSEIVVLHGEPLVGKSTLVKMLVRDIQNYGECIVFSVERIENNSLQSFLHQLNITNNFEDILHAFRNVTKKCIVIDGLENTDNENKRRVVNEILVAVREYNNKIKSFGGSTKQYWKIICTSRTLNIDKILINLETRISIQNNALQKLELHGLSKEEKEGIIKKKPNLKLLINNKKLQDLFSRPGILDLACIKNFPTQKQVLEQINSESQFMAIFWEHVISRDVEMVSGTGTPLDREKLVLNIAKHSLLEDVRIQIDSGIDYESLKGLQDDRIIQQENNGLYFVYDYIEDWACAFLLKNNFETVFNKIQNKPDSLRIISSFRLFSQFLLDVEKNPDEWMKIVEFLKSKINSPRWESEWISSPMFSPNFQFTLDLLSDYLIKNEKDLLTKLLRSLRLVGVTYDIKMLFKIGLRQDEIITALPTVAIPIYDKWEPILKFILSNFERIEGIFLLEYSNISRIWMEKTNGNKSFRSELTKKNLELLSEYMKFDLTRQKTKISYSDEEKFRENLVYSVLQASDILPNEIDSFIRFYTTEKTRDYHGIYEYILKNGWAPLVRFLPHSFVDVMIQILCENLKPDRYGWGSLYGLGIRHDDTWFVPSPLLEPFYPLLKLHPEEGLRLIHKIVNHSTLAWRIREHKESPVVQTLDIDNKILNLWGDYRVFRWFRFYSLGSHAVCCALMALEKWMDESIKAGMNSKALFTKILLKTNCVGVVGVCCSVALANPRKIDNSILVSILENPVFWLMDEHRKHFDLYENKSLLNGLYSYQYPYSMAFHKKIAEQPHRQMDISQLVPLILLSDDKKLKKRLVGKMERFENNIPICYKKENNYIDSRSEAEKTSDMKRSCRLWALHSDIKNYRKIEQNGGVGYYFYNPDHFTENDSKSLNSAEEHLQLATYRMWAHKFLVNNEIGSSLTIENAINYSKELENTFENKDNFAYMFSLDFITNLAAALIMRKWEYIVEKNLVEWCTSKIIKAGEIKSNETPVGINPDSFDRAVAYCLPYLYNQTNEKRIKNMIKLFGMHRVDEVRYFLFNNLQILWNVDSKLIWECINNIIQASTNGKNLTNCEMRQTYSNVLFSILFVIPKDQKIIQIKESKKILKLVEELLKFTIKAYHVFQKDRGYNEWHHFEWNRLFFEILSNVVLRSDKEYYDKTIVKILLNSKKSPSLLLEFLRQFLLSSFKDDLDKIAQPLWYELCEKIMQSNDFITGYHDYRKEIVGLLIFDDAIIRNSWNASHTQWIKLHVPLIQNWCKKFGTSTEYFPSLVKLLNSVGFDFIFEYGIDWLSNIVEKISDKKYFFSESRISTELDTLLWRTWNKHSDVIKQSPNVFQHFSFLVDVIADEEKPYSISLQKTLENIVNV